MELRTATKSCRKNFWMIPSRNIQKVDKTHEYSRLNFIRKTTNPKDRCTLQIYTPHFYVI